MSVQYDPASGLITIHTSNTTYQMLADSHRYLLHLYYGPRIEGSAAGLQTYMDRGFSANPEDAGGDRTYSLDQLTQEFPFRGSADTRTAAFRMRGADGSYGCDLRFRSLCVCPGKYVLPGLPASYDSIAAPCTQSAADAPEGTPDSARCTLPAPAPACGGGGAETLDITLCDAVSGVEVHLLYGIFAAEDVITRAVRTDNRGTRAVSVEKAASCTLDFPYGDFETLTFYGRHAMERNVQRTMVGHGRCSIASLRGASSHFYNPFVILMERGTNEDAGNAYGVHLVYSGNFLAEAERNGYDQTRFVMGLHDEGFSWKLEPGESFCAPECIMTFSAEGLSLLSNRLHRFIRDHVIRDRAGTGPAAAAGTIAAPDAKTPAGGREQPAGRYDPGAAGRIRKPVLINNWEATYFDFDGEKILSIAQRAAELGIEMLVLDDGWFGRRTDDTVGLGDWTVNEEKLGMSLGELSARIHALRPARQKTPAKKEPAAQGTSAGSGKTPAGDSEDGCGMKFGLWFEPEMVSEESDLYRTHPEWVMRIPGRSFSRGRDQLALDFARPEVVDAVYEQMTAVLDHAQVDYIKWDLNRNLTDVFCAALPPERQGEAAHRNMLGVYDLLERICTRYPDLLIEGCAGGGGRFDCGMLYYTPQIWCSDNTDAADRCLIQYGTSFGYPPVTMGAHVSAVPNHQTGRVTPFGTRAAVAMAGTFGYELDLTKLSAEEAAQVSEQMRQFQDEYEVTHYGDYYRLSDPCGAFGPGGSAMASGGAGSFGGAGIAGPGAGGAGDLAAWMCVAADKSRAVVTAVQLAVHGNPLPHYLRLKGLDESARYISEETGREYPGSLLLHAGLQLPPQGLYDAAKIHLRRI